MSGKAEGGREKKEPVSKGYNGTVTSSVSRDGGRKGGGAGARRAAVCLAGRLGEPWLGFAPVREAVGGAIRKMPMGGGSGEAPLPGSSLPLPNTSGLFWGVAP